MGLAVFVFLGTFRVPNLIIFRARTLPVFCSLLGGENNYAEFSWREKLVFFPFFKYEANTKTYVFSQKVVLVFSWFEVLLELTYQIFFPSLEKNINTGNRH